MMSDKTRIQENPQEVQNQLKTYVVRPSISGLAMESVKSWLEVRVEVNQNALGELVTDLYKDYLHFCEIETLPKEATVSRKTFPLAVFYILFYVNACSFVSFTEGRRGAFIGIQLKKNASDHNYSQALEKLHNEN